jgi:hypothetical protein
MLQHVLKHFVVGINKSGNKFSGVAVSISNQSKAFHSGSNDDSERKNIVFSRSRMIRNSIITRKCGFMMTK